MHGVLFHRLVLLVAFDESLGVITQTVSHPVLAQVRWFASESVAQDFKLSQHPEAAAAAEIVRLTTAEPVRQPGDRYGAVAAGLHGVLDWEPSSVAFASYDTVWLAGLALLALLYGADGLADRLPVLAEVYEGAFRYPGFNEAGDMRQADHAIMMVAEGAWTRVATHLAETDELVAVP